MPTCVKIATDHCLRLHPPSVSQGTLFVCVCVCLCTFAIAFSPHHPLHTTDVHSPSIWLVGGSHLHGSRLRPILARGSIHRVYHEGHCVCVCLFAIACSPHPPLRPPDVHSPLIKLVGGPRLHVSRFLPIIARGSIHPVYHGDIVGVCVCHCLLLPPPTASSRCS